MSCPEKTLSEEVVELLIARRFHISCAESCTGGLLTAGLVDVPNASQVLEASIVTYANWAKTRYAAVPEDVLARCGAVSEEVALAMAQGVAQTNQAEVGVGVSGVAGPGGGTAEKPVGMVCFGFFIQGRGYAFTRNWPGLTRNQVRENSVKFALEKLIELLSGEE